jgi:hypothetical protein
VPLAVEHVVALELNCHVLDAEEPHRVMDVLENVLVLLRLANYAMCAHRDNGRRHRPDVQIVHGLDARYCL